MNRIGEQLKTYQTPEVRDLAWAVLSAPLAAIPGAVHWPSNDWYTCSYRNIEDQLRELDNNPTPLLDKIAARKASRLGFYFETLIEMWCELETAIELVATNPQISRADGSTLGAFDFLVKVNGKLEHWECAIKFYLGHTAPDNSDASLWYGPNRQDRLDLKLGHMQSNQLELGNSDEGKAWLAERELNITQTRSIVKGCIFYPSLETIAAPEYACDEHNRSIWLEQSQFEREYRQRGQWVHLPRLCWLAPRTSAELEHLPEVDHLEKPALLSRCDNGWEAERIFVVPDGWEKAEST